MPIFLNSLLIILIAVTVSACSQTPPSSGNHSFSSHSSSTHQSAPSYRETGKASFYANKYQGRQTASGDRFNQRAKTAAHRKLPFGSWVNVTNVNNGKSVKVRINDRGPFIKGRIIDLSKSAFNAIANTRLGIVDVVVEVIR